MNQQDEQRRVSDTYRRYALSRRRSRSWSADNPGNLAIRSELARSVLALTGAELPRARRILDIGCGSGWWLEHLAARADIRAVPCGVDILSERIEGARKRLPRARLQVADARELPYEPDSFDAVTMFTMLSSLGGAGDARRALQEAARVLAPQGVIVIWEPRVPNPLNRQTLLISRRLLREALPNFAAEARTLTLLPPVARRLGRHTDALYPLLARIPALRTHRLTALRQEPPRR